MSSFAREVPTARFAGCVVFWESLQVRIIAGELIL